MSVGEWADGALLTKAAQARRSEERHAHALDEALGEAKEKAAPRLGERLVIPAGRIVAQPGHAGGVPGVGDGQARARVLVHARRGVDNGGDAGVRLLLADG